MEDEQGWRVPQCDERDFNTIMELARILVRHSSHVFYRLPETQKMVLRNASMKLCLNALPPSFTSQDFQNTAQKYKIPPRTGHRYLNEFLELKLIQRVHHGEDILVDV